MFSSKHRGWRVLLVALCCAAIPRSVPATPFPGPDAFGYSGIEIPPMLRDVSATGTFVPLGDDQLGAPLPIGFSFDFYGISYSDFRISSNGFITLGPSLESNGCCTGQPIPNPSSPNNFNN